MSERDQSLPLAVFDLAPVPQFICDFESLHFIQVNSAWEKMTGWSRESVIGISWWELGMHTEEIGGREFWALLYRVQTDRQRICRRVSFLRQNGELRIGDFSVQVVRINEARCVIGFIEDVTGEVSLSRDLNTTKKEFAQLFDFSPVGVAIVDPASLTIQEHNRSLAAFFGFLGENLLGKKMEQLTGESWREEEKNKLGEVLKGLREGYEMEYAIARDDNDALWVRKTVVAVRSVSENLEHLFAFYEDISQHKKLEDRLRREGAILAEKVKERTEELEVAVYAAERANNAKSLFLAKMSHELRTPLNGIIGMTELAEDAEDRATRTDFLRVARESAEALLTIVNDILDFSKIEAGKYELESELFSPETCVDSAVKLLSLKAEQKGIKLLCDVAPEVPPVALGDPGRLRQIILNLLGNAIKFTDEGKIEIEVSMEYQTQEEMSLLFKVKDTGEGIPFEKQDKIFDAFSQVDDSVSRRHEGTGLGLTICAQLVNLMAGKIWLESEVGQGSTFFFLVHFKRARAAEKMEIDLHGKRILVADANPAHRKSFTEMLESRGAEVVAFDSMDRLLEGWEHACEKGVDLFLSDLCFGYERGEGIALWLEKSMPKRVFPVILMVNPECKSCGPVLPPRRTRYLRVSLLKPLYWAELDAAIDRCFYSFAKELEKESAQEETVLHKGKLAGIKVLVAEDNHTNQMVLLHFFEGFGVRSKFVATGIEAVHAIEKENFDLVLMDVNMPEMDGIQATKVIRETEKSTGSHQLIYAITAMALHGDKEMCMAAGMDGYLSKPVRKKELADVLWKVYGGEGGKKEPSSEEIGENDRGSAINAETILSDLGGDIEFAVCLAETGLRELPVYLEEIREASKKSNANLLRVAAHTAKTLFAQWGAVDARNLAYELEKLGTQGHLPETLTLLPHLEKEFERVIAALQSFVAKNRKDNEAL